MANITQINGNLINAATASYIAGVSTLAGVQVFRTSSYNLTDVFTNLTFTNTSSQTAPSIIYQSTTNKDRIYVNQAGVYQVSYQASAGGTTAINEFFFQVVKNDTTPISGSNSYGRNSSTDTGAASAQSLVQLAAGDYVTLQTKMSASAIITPILISQSSMLVIKLDGITGATGSSAAAFPYSGSAVITGSLLVSGSINVTGGITGSLLGTASFSSNTFTNLKTVRLEMGVSSTTAITTGAKGRKTVSFNGTIVGWRLVADQSTTTTVDIWKSNLAIPTVANVITAAAKPTLTAAQLAGSTTLTGWTTSVVDGDVFILNINSNNNATYICLEIDIVLTNA